MTKEYWKNFWVQHAQSTLHSPVQCQVLRTLNKQPIESEVFAQILSQIEGSLALTQDDVLLDLCCGNGVITTYLADRCASVVGIDCSKDLLDHINTQTHRNVMLRVEDVGEAALPEGYFTKALLYAGIQYFTEEQIVKLLCRVASTLRPRGKFYLGDVPDFGRLWAFFDSVEREKAYFNSIRENKPIIGTWLDPIWLSKLARYAGFDEVCVQLQPPQFPYAHYRFDMIMIKS